MTTEYINTMIATRMGWRREQRPSPLFPDGMDVWVDPEGRTHTAVPLFNFITSYMRQAEEWISANGHSRGYNWALAQVTGVGAELSNLLTASDEDARTLDLTADWCHDLITGIRTATTAQRAEAFLRVFDEWEEPAATTSTTPNLITTYTRDDD